MLIKAFLEWSGPTSLKCAWQTSPGAFFFLFETEVHLHKALMRAKVPRVTLN